MAQSTIASIQLVKLASPNIHRLKVCDTNTNITVDIWLRFMALVLSSTNSQMSHIPCLCIIVSPHTSRWGQSWVRLTRECVVIGTLIWKKKCVVWTRNTTRDYDLNELCDILNGVVKHNIFVFIYSNNELCFLVGKCLILFLIGCLFLTTRQQWKHDIFIIYKWYTSIFYKCLNITTLFLTLLIKT